ncbi:MAG: AAA family ATPase, partial [Oscillatoriales cyanobacterium RM1_1_9]|nr:AAA family ATPase [Oscillatoriales cyanobacterium RM1_1_9]
MRPVKLTFQGFTSFRKRQEIDFSQLELFAITGPVGAGKSSILDAMTLALYGKVARDLRAAELCNLGSKVLEVGLEFQVSQQSYYVYRKWDFHTKKAKPEFSLTQKIEGDWQPLGEPGQEAIDQTIKQILRMDFETFTRVILLPQGEFSKFLKGVARERRVILRQLVGYEIFEQMRSRAEDQKRTSRNQIDSLQSELANLQLYSPEELQGWKSQLQTLTQQEPQLSQELTQAQWDWEIEKNLLQQIQVFTQFQAQFVQHLQGEAEILNLQQKLEVAQSAERLETPWELLASTRIRQSEFAVKGQTLAIQVEQARQNFQRQTDSFQQFQQREQTQQATLKQQRLDLDDAIGLEAKLQLQKIEVERSQEQFQQKIQQLETKKQELQTVTEALQQLEQADQKADQALAKTSPGGAYLQQLEQVYPQLQKYSILCQQLVKDYQTLQGVLEELTQYQTQVIGATDHFQQAQRAHLQAEVQYQQ